MPGYVLFRVWKFYVKFPVLIPILVNVNNYSYYYESRKGNGCVEQKAGSGFLGLWLRAGKNRQWI